MKLKTILLLLCSVSVALSYGQYDWTRGALILKNGDTLKGEINLPMISKNLVAFNGKEKVKYRQNKKAKQVKYGEDEVERVIFKNSDTEVAHYEFINTSKDKKGLFKIITTGNATLYARSVSVSSSSGMSGGGVGTSGYDYSFNESDEFYILKENETIANPLITVGISRSFKQRAMEYFSDCSSLVSKLENKTYEKKDIKIVVEEYNKCK